MVGHPMMIINEQLDAIGFEQLTVSTVAVALASIPSGAKLALMSLDGGSIRFTIDGTTPTNNLGHGRASSAEWNINGRNNLHQFRAIRSGGTDGTVQVTYFGVKR